MTLDRRAFLQTSGLATGLAIRSMSVNAQHNGRVERNLIYLNLVGGPSHLDTFDPKPNAPAHVRGPFQPIATRTPGIMVSELFPRLADITSHIALVRSVYHDSNPIHETGMQLLQTGRLATAIDEAPHFGALLSAQYGPREGVPPFVLLPGPVGNTGVSISHGQTAGHLPVQHEPISMPLYPPLYSRLPLPLQQAGLYQEEKASTIARYGDSPFGRACLIARRLIETGVRCVTVNMFQTVYDTVSWDCHADMGSCATTLADYRQSVCPAFDWAYSALVSDLAERGLLSTTLVVASGEFGRTPMMNRQGGRGHWPGVWTVLLAGAGIPGEQIIGASDAWGGCPQDQPIRADRLATFIQSILGLTPSTNPAKLSAL
jgi:uncharacterized protein (DUF1501 family)